MSAAREPLHATGPDGACITCRDAAERGTVIEVDLARNVIVESESGVRRSVAAELVPDLEPGDVVLVHGGIAIGRAPTEPGP